MNRGTLVQVIAMLTGLAITSCGQPKDQSQEVGDSYNKGGTTTSTTSDGFNRELVKIPVAFGPYQSGLSLASATSYTITLSGCATGYTSTATNASTNLQVYKYDHGCLAKLTTFAINGKSYTPKAGSTFTTWQANDTAVFEVVADPTDTLNVKVVSTVADPVTGAEVVEYKFYKLLLGSTSTILDSTVGSGDSMVVGGQGAPSFTISSIQYTGTSATGAGQFIFKMECTADITGAAATTACLDGLYSDMRYKLIEDTYGSTLTLAQADALFPTDENSITIATDTIAVGASGTTHGGFFTSTLDGPDAMHTHPHMLLVIQVADLSYTYFNVDVTTLTQN